LAQVLPTDLLEHLTIRVRPNQIDVTAFLLSRDQAVGRRTAERIVGSALRRAPELSGWRLSDRVG
jgi:hypothetical protein